MAKRDVVRLVVPAMPEFLRLARITAAGLASRLGFSFDQVEDLRLAIDELCYGLVGNHGHPEGTVHVRYVIGDDSLEVQGQGRFDGLDRNVQLNELSQVILNALVDEHDLAGGPDGAQFRLVKRRQPDAGDPVVGSPTTGPGLAPE